ncbi:hypothetical protein [Stappia sp.]|jgi:hypothetical protein|uniref:hypothetical protein n=1 Tax=Stappia sp. TaxID=1870903 RepID=UPI0025F63EE4|nr:hypothetical protein [Stappia sp.]|tara:strand:- start:202 stop:390 length:189 start_codon:yes stop_codon:yes gene_type:complete
MAQTIRAPSPSDMAIECGNGSQEMRRNAGNRDFLACHGNQSVTMRRLQPCIPAATLGLFIKG